MPKLEDQDGGGKVTSFRRTKPPQEQKHDEFIEPRILTGMIVSTEFLERVRPLWDEDFIESPEAATVARWVCQYHDDYGQAPGEHIQDLYMQKLQEGLPTDRGENIELLLERASKDFKQGDSLNVNYLYERALAYFREQHLRAHEEYVRDLREEGRYEEAERAQLEFQPLAAGLAAEPAGHIKSLAELAAEKPQRPPLLLKPWLRAGETNIIFGDDSVGKTLLSLLLSYILGLKDYDSEPAEIGPWQVKRPTGVLYVDGEMGAADLHDRLSAFDWIGPQSPDHQVHALCAPDYQLATDQDLDLSDPAIQRSITSWLEAHPQYRVVVLDSLSTLFPLENESDNSEWVRKVQPLLTRLRGMGVAQIILHHAGKNGDLRGASAMRAMPANIMKLVEVPGRNPGEAHFTISTRRSDGGKQRDPKAGFQPFPVRFFQPEAGRTEWESDTHQPSPRHDRYKLIVAALVRGDRKQSQIAKEFGINETAVTRTKNKAKDDGYLDAQGKPTSAGQELADDLGE